MLIYANHLWLECKLDFLLDEVGVWLSRKLNRKINHEILNSEDRISFNSKHLTIERCDHAPPFLYSFRLTHPDNDRNVTGRQWVTEIGIQQKLGHPYIECSVLLETNEVSLRVNSDISMTRPFIVKSILENCSPSRRTPGMSLNIVDEDNADDLWKLIDNPDRNHPIILVSPTREGYYLIDPEDILFQVGGVADVVQIAEKANTFKVEDILTRQYAVWDGAINIIYPVIDRNNEHTIHNRRFMPPEIETLYELSDNQPAKELLSIICHRVNLPNKWKHISPEKVKLERTERLLKAKREEQLTLQKLDSHYGEQYREQTAQFEAIFDELYQEKQRELDASKNDNYALMEMIETLEYQLNQKDIKIASLEHGLNKSNYNGNQQFSPTFQQALSNIIKENLNLEDCLHILEEMFPARLEILDTAYSSAGELSNFRRTKQALQLMWTLATDYYDTMNADAGGGDTKARQYFGRNDFSAKESDRTLRSERARNERTFRYQGKDILMERHLAIGVKDDSSETWRLHFYWDAEKNTIIIGHCGKHLYLPGH